MSAYNYTALNPQGREVKGVMEGDSERQIRQKLRDQGMTPLEVTTVAQESQKGQVRLGGKQKIKVPELALLTRQLATLLAAGIPLEETLMGVAEQTEKPKTKSILIAVRAKVMEGYTLANGLTEFPYAFSKLYRATVAAGEQTGHLDIVLDRLADYTEKLHVNQQKIKQALIYPIVMTIVSTAIVIFMLIYVVPKMISVFATENQALPLATRSLIFFSHFIHEYGIYFLAGFIVIVVAFLQGLRSRAFKKKVHGLLLKIPLIGRSIKTIETARFSRTFGILTAAGVPVLEGMKIGSDLISNIPIYEAINDAILKVREGTTINRALKQTGYFQAMSLHLIASGEASGSLEAMLERAANNQDQEVQGAIESLLSLFEPALILIMGSIVLFIVMAVMLPVFSMDQYNG